MLRKIAKGFTLIELMIVVAIIGILAAIAIPNFVKFQCRSKQSEAKTNLKAVFVAQEGYRSENDRYDTLVRVGYAPKGNKIRYEYTTNNTSNAATNVASTFLATATGTQDAVAADIWTINNDNALLNTTNICESTAGTN